MIPVGDPIFAADLFATLSALHAGISDDAVIARLYAGTDPDVRSILIKHIGTRLQLGADREIYCDIEDESVHERRRAGRRHTCPPRVIGNGLRDRFSGSDTAVTELFWCAYSVSLDLTVTLPIYYLHTIGDRIREKGEMKMDEITKTTMPILNTVATKTIPQLEHRSRFIPESYKLLSEDPALGIEIWGIDSPPKAVAFHGRAERPDWHFNFASLTERDERIRKHYAPRKLYIPKGYVLISANADYGLEVWGIESPPRAVAFHGRAVKPDWHIQFDDLALRDKQISEYCNGHAAGRPLRKARSPVKKAVVDDGTMRIQFSQRNTMSTMFSAPAKGSTFFLKQIGGCIQHVGYATVQAKGKILVFTLAQKLLATVETRQEARKCMFEFMLRDPGRYYLGSRTKLHGSDT